MNPSVVIPTTHEAVVTATRQITPKIFLVQLTPEQSLTYNAGQYASWLIREYRRPLSYATPDNYPYLEFVIDVSPGGIASRYTKQLTHGDTVRFMSPYGRFVVDRTSARPRLFIATGSGIGPIRAQILAELAHDPNAQLTLIFGNKDEHYMFFDDEFTELAHIHPHFTFVPVCSEPGAEWPGERGLVTDITPRRVKGLSTYDSYICGSPAMVKDMTAVLLTAGVPKEQIHGEQFT